MLLLLFARGLFRLSANTPDAEVFIQLPPRKGSDDLPPKGLMCHGSRPDFPGLLAASMRLVFFADLADRHGNGPLLSLCSGPEPVSFGYLA